MEKIWCVFLGAFLDTEGLRAVVEVEVEGVEGALTPVGSFVCAIAVFLMQGQPNSTQPQVRLTLKNCPGPYLKNLILSLSP